MSTGWNVFTYLFLAFFILVGLFATVLCILIVRHKVMRSKVGNQGKDEEVPKYDDLKPIHIPEPMAAYFPRAYRHQMDMEIWSGTAAVPPPMPRPAEKVPVREHRKHNHLRSHRQSRRLM
ncbi:hypothetical protein E1B28_013674 [Marasmius oreades]|uniref:Uncharacterized protein n=1 Tax=Marasmius oreades TaxID=181124 RepID=A0A9P7RQV6_9AGAR|nr:uncharacterized protein E1B28_013674 [Marasmius oreades]KAG7087728.1 hypothetical protein E1B28_013674 [Marasmius oreades]